MMIHDQTISSERSWRIRFGATYKASSSLTPLPSLETTTFKGGKLLLLWQQLHKIQWPSGTQCGLIPFEHDLTAQNIQFIDSKRSLSTSSPSQFKSWPINHRHSIITSGGRDWSFDVTEQVIYYQNNVTQSEGEREIERVIYQREVEGQSSSINKLPLIATFPNYGLVVSHRQADRREINQFLDN